MYLDLFIYNLFQQLNTRVLYRLMINLHQHETIFISTIFRYKIGRMVNILNLDFNKILYQTDFYGYYQEIIRIL